MNIKHILTVRWETTRRNFILALLGVELYASVSAYAMLRFVGEDDTGVSSVVAMVVVALLPVILTVWRWKGKGSQWRDSHFRDWKEKLLFGAVPSASASTRGHPSPYTYAGCTTAGATLP
jgi:hypothetical protein